MDSPHVGRRFIYRWISNKRKNTTKFMILFASLLASIVISIHSRYTETLISNTDESILKRHNKGTEITTPVKKQKFVLIYGTDSSGYTKVQNDFSTWTQKFQIYPYAWALPELSSENYSKDQNFGPFMKSLAHLHTTVPETEYTFDRQKYAESKFLLSKFQDGFIEQWVQGRNILLGSDELNIILDEKYGDDFFRAFVKTLPWNDTRFDLLNEGTLSVIILHRSAHKRHIIDLWSKSKKHLDGEKDENFSTWLLNSFNFDVIDSYGLAHKLMKKGIQVSLINVDDVKDDLSQFVSCNLLEFSCEDGAVVGLQSDFNEEASQQDIGDNDLNETVLDDIEKAIKRHEDQYKRCLHNVNNKVEFYPRQDEDHSIKAIINSSCPEKNDAIRYEIRNIAASSHK